MDQAVIAIVDSRPEAQRIIERLRERGVPAQNISMLLPDKSGTHDVAHETNTKAPEGAIAGVGAGGFMGGALGLLVGVGAIAIPGLGPLLVAGPLLGLLSGAATGAAVGGVTGALIGLGIPEIEAKIYEGHVRGGNLLLAIHTANADEEVRVRQVLQESAAHDIAAAGEVNPPPAVV